MNGDGQLHGNTSDYDQIVQALEAVYSPRSSNSTRREATVWLDNIKLDRSRCAAVGYEFAINRSRSTVARHFGLSLLEHNIRYQYDLQSSEDCEHLKAVVLALARSSRDEDPILLRNKIAQLWVELAKRSWLSTWNSMDEQLCELWSQSLAQREIVLYILEMLSDETFTKDESAALVHGQELGKACVEVFTSANDFALSFPDRTSIGLRFGEEGWLQRLASMAEMCYKPSESERENAEGLLVKLYAVMRSVMPWIPLRSVAATRSVELLCRALTGSSLAVQTASVMALHALYHRSNYHSEDIKLLVCPILSSDGLALLQRTYDASYVEADDIDDEKYTLLKKFTEILCALASFVEQRTELMLEQCNIPLFLQFLVRVLQNPSMVVSIPVLYIWTKLLASRPIATSEIINSLVGTLLDVCKSRLLKYESLPPDSTDATLVFLNEDFDTVPERHAFVGNYRRFSMEIIERVVRKSPFEAVQYILSQADNVMQNLLKQQKPIERLHYSTSSPSLLELDAQTTVVMTALKGYIKYIAHTQSRPNFPDEQHSRVMHDLENWCRGFSRQEYEDPGVQKRIIQFVCDICVSILPPSSSVPRDIVEHVLGVDMVLPTGDSVFDEAVRDLHGSLPKELQKLAARFSDQLVAAYNALETRINAINATGTLELRIKLEYQAFLFIIVHRCTNAQLQEKQERLKALVDPVAASWRDPAVNNAASSFPQFCAALGLEGMPSYFLGCQAQNIQDWSTQPLDSVGLALRDRISNLSERLPLQATRTLLAASTDRIRPDSEEFEIARSQWEDAIPLLLPNLLQLLGFAHAFNNPSNWIQHSPDMDSIIKRILVDRVWQSGISSESRDDFYARVRNSKTSLEGLASTIRAAVRGVRELSYWVLHCSCQFDRVFYGHHDLPEPIARALYTDAHTLSTHQLSTLLRLSTALIDSCPPAERVHFLPVLLTSLFKQLDLKIAGEWDAIEHRTLSPAGADEEALDREMKAESVLRQLTHSAVVLVSSLLAHRGPGASSVDPPSTRTLILLSPDVLEPLILFCTHALRMRDSRSCSIITRVLRHLVDEFTADEHTTSPIGLPAEAAAQVREFFSTEVLKACITSLHEPYFADMQKDLAWLVAHILVLYGPKTPTPRNVLLSLPGMTEEKVDRHLAEMMQTSSERAQRHWALSLLEGLRGVSIHEQGKVNATNTQGSAKKKTAMQQHFSTAMDEQPSNVIRGGTPEGLADLFG